MASLNLSRIVNDALQSGDIETVLTSLRLHPDLRISDLPKLEKKSLSSSANSLHIPQNAQLWVEALLDEAHSVRLFAIRTLLRFGQEARHLSVPLRQSLTEFWEKQTPPDAETTTEQTAQLRRAQEEALVRAVELLFCVDVENALQLCREQVKIYVPIELAHQRQYKEGTRRSELARQAIQDALGEVLAVPDWVKDGKPSLFQMANWVEPEVYKQVYNRPDIQELLQPYGEDQWQWRSQHWNPLQSFRGALHALAQSKKEPQKAALEQMRVLLRRHLGAGLEDGDEESAHIALAFLHNLTSFDFEFTFQEFPALLTKSRAWIVSLPEEHPSHHLWVALSQWFFNAFYGYSRNVRFDWEPQVALDLFDVLQLNPEEPSEFNKRLEEARVSYRHNLPEQKAARENLQNQAQLKATTAFQEMAGDEKLFLPLARIEGESVRDFLRRAHTEKVDGNQKYEAATKEVGWSNDISQQFHQELQWWNQQFQEILVSFSDEDKREMLLECCRSGELPLTQIGEWWKDKSLLQPLLSALWALWDETLDVYAHDQKMRMAGQSSSSEQGERNHTRIYNTIMLVDEAVGIPGQHRLIQRALRSKAKRFVQPWEQHMLAPLGHLPIWPRTHEAWMAWRLDESVDEALEFLAGCISRWLEFDRERGYSQLAIAFYRRYTEETRLRCHEFANLAKVPSEDLFQIIDVHEDEWTWLAILSGAREKSPQFFEFWNSSRAEEKTRKRIVGSVLKSLAGAPSENGAAMMLQMLGEVDVSELKTRTGLIVQSIEHPQLKVAKWALETLQKMPDAELDWPNVIENAGEKLWSDNVGLAKVAARFLGNSPTSHVPLAWEKLEEALPLENLAIVEVVVRALNELKRKNQVMNLGDAGVERLETLSQLSPERFTTLLGRLKA